MEKCEELLPDYYNFVHGVVDSQDLSLNISRETLQHNSQLRAIAHKVEKKITSELQNMRDKDREAYEAFFENFGRGLKYGIYSSYGMNKDELGNLLLFYSAKQQKMITLDEYLEAAGEDAKAIYYAAGESVDRLAKMPVVTSVLGRGHDVLLCTQDVDEFCFQTMQTYSEKELKNVAGGDLGLESEADKTAAEAATKENESLFTAMKDVLGDKVVKVAVSTRLTDAPACITAEGPISLEMEKVMAGMPDADGMKSQRVLEVNAGHPVFETLKAAQEAGDTDKVASYTDILYNQALLVEGLPIDDPVAYAQQICKLMK
jgi:molecular chaperone HtpG